jgi:hypothetical protein
MSVKDTVEIGRVLRASTEGFTCGTRSHEINELTFGSFVQATHGESNIIVIGVITAIRIDDDPLVRQLIMANHMNANTLRDQRENRLVPVEIDVLSIGYVENDITYYSLPPRPPLSLDPVTMCSSTDVAFFTERLDFLRILLAAKAVSTCDLLGATIRKAASARARERQRDFLVLAGRQLAALLSHDLTTLKHVLAAIRPVA